MRSGIASNVTGGDSVGCEVVKLATDFDPSKNQEAMLTASQGEDYGDSVSEACRKAGIERSTFYRWFANPEFAEWWRGQAEAWFGRKLPQVQAAVYAAATERSGKGDAKFDPRAQKLFFERFDKKYTPTQRHETHVTGKLDLSTVTAEELDAMEQAISGDTQE